MIRVGILDTVVVLHVETGNTVALETQVQVAALLIGSAVGFASFALVLIKNKRANADSVDSVVFFTGTLETVIKVSTSAMLSAGIFFALRRV